MPVHPSLCTAVGCCSNDAGQDPHNVPTKIKSPSHGTYPKHSARVNNGGMTHAPPPDEPQRLEALRRYHVLDTPPEAAFDRITRLVKRLLDVQIVIIGFVAARRAWLKSSEGTNIHEMDRDSICCAETVRQQSVFVVSDLHATPRFLNDPMVKFEGARSYAGAPLTIPDGFTIGTLGVYDHNPRHFTPEEQQLLLDLAEIVIDELELRLTIQHWRDAQQHSEHLAHHDALTGLPNRLRFLDRAEQALQHASRHRSPVGIMIVDLDEFKMVNDSLGHHVGDEVLKVVGERLRGALREDDTVARFGGDEFVVLLPELHDSLDAARVAHKLHQALNESVQVNGHALEVTCSTGISLFPADGQDAQALLRAADTAMYQAKASGKGQYRFYEEAMMRAAQQKLQLRSRLAHAVEQQEFRLHYQPQVNLRTGELCGLEALLRWPQEDGTVISPLQFIPLAEESGLIVPLGEWGLREACAQLAGWREQGKRDWCVSVNVSERQWEDPNFLSTVRQVLLETGLPASCVTLEVTESVLLKDPQGVWAQTQELAALGVQLALDDYGTGYSNLSQLRHISVAQLKLDRSFVQPLPGGSKEQALVHSSITLGRGLDAQVVGEGIETQEQLQALRELDCDVGQGYLLGRPVPPGEIEHQYIRT